MNDDKPKLFDIERAGKQLMLDYMAEHGFKAAVELVVTVAYRCGYDGRAMLRKVIEERERERRPH